MSVSPFGGYAARLAAPTYYPHLGLFFDYWYRLWRLIFLVLENTPISLFSNLPENQNNQGDLPLFVSGHFNMRPLNLSPPVKDVTLCGPLCRV